LGSLSEAKYLIAIFSTNGLSLRDIFSLIYKSLSKFKCPGETKDMFLKNRSSSGIFFNLFTNLLAILNASERLHICRKY